MSDPAHSGVTPPPPGTPSIPVAPTSDNPAANTGAQPPAGYTPAAGPAAPAWGQAGYGAPPVPPPPRQPNPILENLKAELIGVFATPTDAQQGKLWAMLCYLPGVFIPLWLIPLVRRNNHLSLFHAKQMLGFAAIQAVMWFGFFMLRVLVGMIKQNLLNAILGWTLLGGLLLVFIAVAVIGLIGAMRGQVKPLPLIGRTVDRMLRSLTVVPPAINPEPQLAYWLRVAPVARPQTAQQPHPHQQPWPQSAPATPPSPAQPQSVPAPAPVTPVPSAAPAPTPPTT